MKATALLAATTLALSGFSALPAHSTHSAGLAQAASNVSISTTRRVASAPAADASRALAATEQAVTETMATTAPKMVDVLARDQAGSLWLYRGNGTGGWISPRLQAGTGWGSMTAVLGPGDFNGDGKADVLARDQAGYLWLYRGNGTGGWLYPRLQAGTGWAGFTAILGPGDFNSDGKADVLACDSAGNLWLYRGNGTGHFSSPRLLAGTGWAGFTALLGPGDFNSDGMVDVLARDPSGYLWLYRGNGTGHFSSPPLRVGTGWNGMTAIVGPGDVNGDGVDCGRVACVALTFDDGPSVYTDRLITSLTSLRVPATFFAVGTAVQARPSIALREQSSGLRVENHTWDHPELDQLSLSAQQTQVRWADDALAAAGVARSTLLRPPYGSWDSDTRLLGKPLILWSVDPRDWDGKTAPQIRSHVATYAVSGSIVLLHDRVAATVDAVPGIVSDLRARGFTLVTVQTLVPWMKPGDVVYSRSNVTTSTATIGSGEEQPLTPERLTVPAPSDEAPFILR